MQEGDIVWFVLDPAHPAGGRLRREFGLVIGHLGIVILDDGQPWLVHAASSELAGWYQGGRIARVPLAVYLERVERFAGVIVTRLQEGGAGHGPVNPSRRSLLGLPAKAWLLIAVLIFVLHAVYYWSWTEDDAFISFRYARNLVDGQGLVFNPGEKVEGYSNFGWVLAFCGGAAPGRRPR